MQLKARRQVFRIALTHVNVAGVGTFFADERAKVFIRNANERIHYSNPKGRGCGLVTGGLRAASGREPAELIVLPAIRQPKAGGCRRPENFNRSTNWRIP